MSIILDGTTGITTPDLIDSSLTSGRVVYAGASGNLTGSSGLTFDGTNLSTAGQVLLNNNNYIGFKNTTGTYAASIFNDTSNFLNLYNSGNTGTIFYVNAAEQMRLTSTGLGIGTSSPVTKLHVNTPNGGVQVRATSDSDVSFFALSTGADSSAFVAFANDARQWTMRVNGAESDQFQLRDSTAGVNRLSVDTAGNLSLISATPAYFGNLSNLLNISINRLPSTGAIFNASQSAAFMNIDGASGGSSFQFCTASANNTQPSERMRITNTGDVAIGTTGGDIFSNSFARSLAVFSSGAGTTTAINVSGGAASRIQFGVGFTRYGLIYQDDTNFMQIATTTALPISFVTNNTERARINSDGGLLVGSTSTAGSVGNYGVVLGGYFKSFSGTTASTASGTYVTLFTASAGTISSYLVTVWISADDVNNYQANVIVNTQAGSSTKVSVIVSGNLLQFQMSGYSLQARQNSGGASTISYSAIRISA
jgi:hypothetical protein